MKQVYIEENFTLYESKDGKKVICDHCKGTGYCHDDNAKTLEEGFLITKHKKICSVCGTGPTSLGILGNPINPVKSPQCMFCFGDGYERGYPILFGTSGAPNSFEVIRVEQKFVK